MTQISDPADRALTELAAIAQQNGDYNGNLDAAADGAFGGKHDAVNRRAGYTDPLAWALKQARKGGTLAAGEGLMLVKHYEALVQQAFYEGMSNGLTWSGSRAKYLLESR